MKKVLLLIIPLMLLAGCSSSLDETDNYLQDASSYYIRTDKETCVEYISGHSRLSVRLNTDGSPMLNEECLERMKRDE